MNMDVDEGNDELKSSNPSTSIPTQSELEYNLKKCRDALSMDPNNYNNHLNVVNALLNVKSMNQYRKARDKMYKKFAIPPAIWLTFINPEIELLSSSPTKIEINNIINLFKKSINDYPADYNFWIHYLQFVFKYKSIIGVNYIRNNIIKDALLQIGTHFSDAHKIWSLYREFETGVLADIVVNPDNGDTPDIDDINSDDSDNDNDNDTNNDISSSMISQVELIRVIWRKQIAQPHLQIEDTYRSYQDWECEMMDHASNDYKDKYNNCKKISKYFKNWEKKLIKLKPNISYGYCEMEKLEFWQKYINDICLKSKNNKNIKLNIIKSLYERAINDCFLYQQIWINYINWIKNNNLKYDILNITSRSIRNIPLSSSLWIEYIYAAEWNELNINDINKRIFNKIIFPKNDNKNQNNNDNMVQFSNINDYINIGMAKCDYYRRKANCSINDKYFIPSVGYDNHDDNNNNNKFVSECIHCFEEISILIDENLDSKHTLSFYKYYTDFVSRFIGDINKARNIWEHILKLNGKNYNIWIEAIKWEQIYGEIFPPKPSLKIQKQLLNINKNNDNNNIKHGLNNIYRIRHLYRRAITILNIETGLVNIGEDFIEFERFCGDLKTFNDAKLRYNKKLNNEINKNKQNEKKRIKTKKRKFNQIDNYKENNVINNNNNNKNVKISSSPPIKKQKINHNQVKQTINDNNKMDIDNNDKDNDNNDENENENKNGTLEERTVFVLNFRKTMKKEDLKILFNKYGKIMSLRLPIDPKSRYRNGYKGYGYIEYFNKYDANKCINELNGKQVQGKILTIQHYRSNTSTENTVYIRGLKHLSYSEAEKCIKTILKDCGKIHEIRITKDKNESIKGFAYVEFVDNNSVINALKLDKYLYNNDRIIDILPYKTKEKRSKEKKQNQKQNKNNNNDNIDDNNDDDNNANDNNDNNANVVSSNINNLKMMPRAIGRNTRKNTIKIHKKNNNNKNTETKSKNLTNADFSNMV